MQSQRLNTRYKIKNKDREQKINKFLKIRRNKSEATDCPVDSVKIDLLPSKSLFKDISII